MPRRRRRRRSRPTAQSPRRADAVARARASVKVDTRKLDNLVDMVGELVIAQSILAEDPALVGVADERLTRNLAQLRRITSDLQRNAMSMRMVPIRQTFQKMARLVRDLTQEVRQAGRAGARGRGHRARSQGRRGHQRSADAHGAQQHRPRHRAAATARLAAGKRETGRLSLSAFHQGGNIVIEIADDGAGLNTERILAKAVAQGLVAPRRRRWRRPRFIS